MSREKRQGASPSGGADRTPTSTRRQQPSRRSRASLSSADADASESSAAGPSTRQSRRRASDPYTRPPPREESEDEKEKEGRAQGEPLQEEPENAEEETPIVVDEERSASASDAGRQLSPTDERFELRMVQQPEIGAEAGMDKVTLGRLPIVPAPVVQVFVRNADGEQVDEELPYLFCSCSLKEDKPEESESVPTGSANASTSGGQDVEEEFSNLIGNLVRNSHRVPDLEGNPGSFFVFEDMSVRTTGTYTLEFRLGEARRPRSPKLAAVVSDPFNVVPWRDYPGRPAADTVTDLSRHFHDLGIPMYIPPFVLDRGLAPPPAGSNPFPQDALQPLPVDLAPATPPSL